MRNKKRRRDQNKKGGGRGSKQRENQIRLSDKKDLKIRRKLERDQKWKKPKRKKNRKRKSIELKTEKLNIKTYASQIDKIAPQNIYTDTCVNRTRHNYTVLILLNY